MEGCGGGAGWVSRLVLFRLIFFIGEKYPSSSSLKFYIFIVDLCM